MPASKQQRAATAERRSQAVRLSLAGMDFASIAARLGYASRAAAYIDVRRALQANLDEQRHDVELLRQKDLQRLDRLQVGVWSAALAGDTKAVDAALRIIDRRIRLLGLDAVHRIQVLTMEAVDAEIARLSAELGVDDGVPHEPSGDEIG